MKAVVYSIQAFEKEFIAKANHKKHDITLISNTLNLQTVQFAEGKDVVVVTVNDDLSADVISALKKLNVRYIANRSNNTDHIDKIQASILGIKIANVFDLEPQEIAMQTIRNLDNWQANKCNGKTCACGNPCISKSKLD